MRNEDNSLYETKAHCKTVIKSIRGLLRKKTGQNFKDVYQELLREYPQIAKKGEAQRNDWKSKIIQSILSSLYLDGRKQVVKRGMKLLTAQELWSITHGATIPDGIKYDLLCLLVPTLLANGIRPTDARMAFKDWKQEDELPFFYGVQGLLNVVERMSFIRDKMNKDGPALFKDALLNSWMKYHKDLWWEVPPKQYYDATNIFDWDNKSQKLFLTECIKETFNDNDGEAVRKYGLFRGALGEDRLVQANRFIREIAAAVDLDLRPLEVSRVFSETLLEGEPPKALWEGIKDPDFNKKMQELSNNCKKAVYPISAPHFFESLTGEDVTEAKKNTFMRLSEIAREKMANTLARGDETQSIEVVEQHSMPGILSALGGLMHDLQKVHYDLDGHTYYRSQKEQAAKYNYNRFSALMFRFFPKTLIVREINKINAERYVKAVDTLEKCFLRYSKHYLLFSKCLEMLEKARENILDNESSSHASLVEIWDNLERSPEFDDAWKYEDLICAGTLKLELDILALVRRMISELLLSDQVVTKPVDLHFEEMEDD